MRSFLRQSSWLVIALGGFILTDPAIGGWAVLLVVFVPWWMWLARTKTGREAFWGSFWLGTGVTLTRLAWLFLAIPYPWIDLPRLVVVPIGLLLTLLFIALQGLAFGLIGRFAWRHTATGWLLAFPIVWAAWELVRPWLSFGIDLQSFLWSLGNLPAIPELLTRSSTVLTLGLVLVNILVFRLLVKFKKRSGERGLLLLSVGVLIIAASLSWLIGSDQTGKSSQTLPITIWNRVEIEPVKLTTEEQTTRLTKLKDIIRAAPPGQLIVGPENTLALSDVTTAPVVFQEQPILDELAATLKEGQVLLIGIIRETDSQFINAALVMDEYGVLGWSAKEYLIPFGETLPDLFQRLLPSGWLTPYTTLDPSLKLERTVQTPQVVFGFAFCSELFYRTILGGFETAPDYLVILANDSHVMSRQFARLQLAVARIRAVQLGRTVILATTSAQSAIVDPSGQVIVASDFGLESAIMKDKREQE